jgi:hypothetical protein
MTDFDWVKARAECSIAEVFEQLKSEVEADVTAREKLRPKNEAHQHYAFKFTVTGRTFSVFIESNKIHRSASFTLRDNRISIRKDHQEFFALAALNDEGRCVLRVNNKDYERWQVRKMALEELFFSEPEVDADPFAQFGGKKL